MGLSCDFWVCWHTLLVRTSSPKASFSVILTYRNSGLWTAHQPEKCQSKDFWPVVGLSKGINTFATPFAMLQASFCNFHNQFVRPKIKLHLTKQNVPPMLWCNFSFLKGVSIHGRWYCIKKLLGIYLRWGKHVIVGMPPVLGLNTQATALRDMHSLIRSLKHSPSWTMSEASYIDILGNVKFVLTDSDLV